MYHSSLLIFFSCRRLKNEHGQVVSSCHGNGRRFLFVGVNARVAAHYNNHEVSYHSQSKTVEIFTIKLSHA